MADKGVLTKIADAVASAIESNTWDHTVVVERETPPIRRVWDLQTIHVSVTPDAMQETLDTRLAVEREYSVDLLVSVAVDHFKGVDADPLMRMVEQLTDFFSHQDNREIISSPRCMWVRADLSRIQPQDNLRWRVMQNRITLSYIRID